MNLRNARGSQGGGFEGFEDGIEGAAKGTFEGSASQGLIDGGHLVLKLLQACRVGRGKEVRARGQQLAKLHEDRPEGLDGEA